MGSLEAPRNKRQVMTTWPATNRHGCLVPRRGPKERELPRHGIVVDDGIEMKADACGLVDLEGEGVEIDREAHAARLEVRLFQRPEFEKTLRTLTFGKACEGLDLSRREEICGRREGRIAALGIFDVDSHLEIARDDESDQAACMRQIEAKVTRLTRRRDERTPVRVQLEFPGAWVDRSVAREQYSKVRAREERGVPIDLETKSSNPLPLGLGDELPVRCQEIWIACLGVGKPDMRRSIVQIDRHLSILHGACLRTHRPERCARDRPETRAAVALGLRRQKR